MNPPRWTTAELDSLESIAANMPPDLVSRNYNSWATRNGYPNRTHQALLTRISRCGMGRVYGDWLSSSMICRTIGVSINTTQYWSDRYDIPCHRDGRRARFFRRSDLIRVARERPEIFGGIPADQLFLLLEDRQLADAIAVSHPRRAMEPRPVRAIETGWHYPSVRAAAARMFIARQAITYSIRTGGTAAGYHWTYA